MLKSQRVSLLQQVLQVPIKMLLQVYFDFFPHLLMHFLVQISSNVFHLLLVLEVVQQVLVLLHEGVFALVEHGDERVLDPGGALLS